MDFSLSLFSGRYVEAQDSLRRLRERDFDLKGELQILRSSYSDTKADNDNHVGEEERGGTKKGYSRSDCLLGRSMDGWFLYSDIS